MLDSPLWQPLFRSSWSRYFILHTFLHPVIIFFRSTCPYHRSLFCCNTNAVSSVLILCLGGYSQWGPRAIHLSGLTVYLMKLVNFVCGRPMSHAALQRLCFSMLLLIRAGRFRVCSIFVSFVHPCSSRLCLLRQVFLVVFFSTEFFLHSL